MLRWQRITIEVRQCDHLARNLQPFHYIKQTQTKDNDITTMNGAQQCLKETQFTTTASCNRIGYIQSGPHPTIAQIQKVWPRVASTAQT